MSEKYEYTYTDPDGIRWRMVGSRPVSEIADQVMDEAAKEAEERWRNDPRTWRIDYER